MDIVEFDNIKKVFYDNFDFNEFRYFYHMGKSGIGDIACEDGLLLAENRLSSTTIEIEENDIKDIDELINSGNGVADFREEMVILACPINEVSGMIRKNEDVLSDWSEEFNADYIIPSKYIIGYINLNDKCFYSNTNSIYQLDCSSCYGRSR